ncbi:hypothetical protein PV326_007657, partial [Microctonus aethiopoides]
KLALKMANVKKLIHLLSLAVILFSIIDFSNSHIFNAPCKDGFYARKDDKNNKTHCVPCPENAICYQNEIWCNKNYILPRGKYVCSRIFGTKGLMKIRIIIITRWEYGQERPINDETRVISEA